MKNRTTSITSLATGLVGVILLTGCQHMPMTKHNSSTQTPQAEATLSSTSTQQPMGKVAFRTVADGVLVAGTVTGLAPNSVHGIHLHENGDCSDMGKAAGGHFNPVQQQHGNPMAASSHAGELPNITADAAGVASINFVNPKISLTSGASNSILNRTLVVHANADDYQSQPAGNSGDRIACAIIQ